MAVRGIPDSLSPTLVAFIKDQEVWGRTHLESDTGENVPWDLLAGSRSHLLVFLEELYRDCGGEEVTCGDLGVSHLGRCPESTLWYDGVNHCVVHGHGFLVTLIGEDNSLEACNF